MQQLYQDSMAIVRRFGKPDLFLTFTCNPQWPEIQAALLPGQTAAERFDIAARVFRMKLDATLEAISKRWVLGRPVARIHVVEYQKRGLPHAHILVFLAAEDKLRTADDYDAVICAELPDPETHPELHRVVVACMMHGPCGALDPTAPCMVEGRCSKGYPHAFCEQTQDSPDGYPIYRRRNNGRTAVVRRRGGADVVLDNRWVVPYNPALLLYTGAHFNVEYCASVRGVKYIHKYVYKGGDRAQVKIGRAHV